MTEAMEIDEEEPSLVEENPKKDDKNEIDDDSEEEEEDSKDVTSQVRKALFAAVEGGFDDAGEDDDDMHSFRPFMRLFVPSKSTRSIKPGANAREVKDLILETVKGFHKGFARRFFADLKPIVKQVIDKDEHIPESAMVDDESLGATLLAENIVPDAKSSRALKFLLYATQVLQAYLDGVIDKHLSGRKSRVGQSISIITEAFETASLLHEEMQELHLCGPDGIPVHSAVLSLCENWWLANATQGQLLIPNVLIGLVSKALGGDGKPAQKADIKRLIKLQDAFRDVEYSDESSNHLRLLLLKVASSPLCRKMQEGKRFICSLFLLDPDLVSDLHQAIRIQMPEAKKTDLQFYGEIYKRAWKDSHKSDCPEEIQAAIEEDVLQDLMYAAIHVANPRMNKALMLVLEPFHEAKKVSDFEGLLHRMYGPILWRALTAANPQVRINAAYILGEVFPLQEPSRAQAAAVFKRGAAAVKALLKDKNPKVRVAGSETAAKVLGTFWEELSTDDIRSLLNHIVRKHASDSSAYQVRVGALKAVTTLLDSPQCHAVLRALLPSLGNLVHDKHKSVRLAAVNMLLKVKTLDGFKYYHVVPTDHLRARLADEGRLSSLNSKAYDPQLYLSPVASGLTQLLLNSYVPQGPGVSAVDQVKKTLSFLSSDPGAGAVFYANLADHLPPPSIAKLASMLLRCFSAAIATEEKKVNETNNSTATKKSKISTKQGSDSESSEDEESDDDNDSNEGKNGDGVLTASNTPFMATLVEVIASLWENILEDLEYEENGKCLELLIRSSSGLTDMLVYFEQQAAANKGKDEEVDDHYRRIQSAILRCAGFLEAKDVDGLVAHISTSLEALSSPNKKGRQQRKVSTESLPSHFALLCLWGFTEDVATSLSASIVTAVDDADDQTFFTPEQDKSKKRKSSTGSRRKSSARNCALPMLPPDIAIEVLNEILVGADPGNVIAREYMMGNNKARESLEEAFEATTQYAGRFFRAAAVQALTVTDDRFQLIVKVCEGFARFALHKAGVTSVEEGTMMELNLEAKHLLEWTTEQVLPALLTEGKPFSLQNLDVSCISLNGSFLNVDIEMDETLEHDPLSPSMTPLAPPRKKGNRQATPERLDGSFEPGPRAKAKSKRKDSKIIPGDSTATMVRCAASTLLQNSCVIFSEWLQVGAGCGTKEIVAAALKWCCILDAKAAKEKGDDKENKPDDKLITFQLNILPSICRLSAMLGTTASDFQLLKCFLHKLPRILDEIEAKSKADELIKSLIQETVAFLLRSASREEAVAAVIEFTYEVLPSIREDTNEKEGENEDASDDLDFPETMRDVCCSGDYVSSRATVVASALEPLTKNKQGSLLLAEKLWSNLHSAIDGTKKKTNEEDKKPFMLFETRCLYYLSEEGACKNAAPFKETLRKIAKLDRKNDEVFGDGNPVGVFLRHLAEVEAVDPFQNQPEAEADSQ